MSASATRPKIKAVIKKKANDYPMTVAELTRLFDEAKAKDDRMRVGLYARAGDTDYFYHESGGRSTDYPTGWYSLFNNDTAQTFKWIRLKNYSSVFTPDTLMYRLNSMGTPKQPCFQVSKPYRHIKGKTKGQCNYSRNPFSSTCRRTSYDTRFY